MPVEPTDMAAGLGQITRYLVRAWYRAGLPAAVHEDATQSVYTSLLGHFGADRFGSIVAAVSGSGVCAILSRDADLSPDFFRAVDAVKKRYQRDRKHEHFDHETVIPTRLYGRPPDDDGYVLRDAIGAALTPRDAALAVATLEGETPAEIAARRGVRAKTVSNEKSRMIEKLRQIYA